VDSATAVVTPTPGHRSRLADPGHRVPDPADLSKETPVNLRKLLRSLQVFVPFLQDARFGLARRRQRASRRLIEPEFAALGLFDWGDEPLFLDIGANRGLATEAIRRLVPQARIAAFEPNPLLYRQLERIFADGAPVTCHNIALGDVSRDTTLWVPVYRNWIFDGLGSLDRREAYEWLNADRLYFFDERHLQLREYPCRIRPLDTLELAPAFVKIDVQGHEMQVLHGGEETLRRAEPLLMIESPRHDAETIFLQGLGYTICAFEEGRLQRGSAGKTNSFFLSSRHLAQLEAAGGA